MKKPSKFQDKEQKKQVLIKSWENIQIGYKSNHQIKMEDSVDACSRLPYKLHIVLND